MLPPRSPLTELHEALHAGRETPFDIAWDAAERANSNASRNTYLRFAPDELLQQAQHLSEMDAATLPLFSVPISLKDCFDLAGTHTTCGSSYYARSLPPATHDSAMADALRKAGALVTGKTHLHPLAYGITGQNPEYGDCLQPRDAALLTGGSSSGAAASVQEGSALAAIGTDTGGSIRVPAALCGLVGFRASHSLASPTGGWPEVWAGAAHLAPSFDTVGLLLRDPRDAAPIAQALFHIPLVAAPNALRIGCISNAFLTDCTPDVITAFVAWQQTLAAHGATLSTLVPPNWTDTLEIFAGIQAHEAAAIHRGHYDEFEPAIRDRLRWGASLSDETLRELRERCHTFRASMGHLFEQFDLLMLPAAPVSRLPADADSSTARQVILRYTTPFSLAGLPALSLPGEMIGAPFGTGVQIAAAPGADPILLAFATSLGRTMASRDAR